MGNDQVGDKKRIEHIKKYDYLGLLKTKDLYDYVLNVYPHGNTFN